jgi:predicted enzyme related to lactoylglutathione lyase
MSTARPILARIRRQRWKNTQGDLIQIKLTSVLVNDQVHALAFYTKVLGFIKKQDIPRGGDRWLTVVSPDGPDDVELLLEPMGFPPAKTYQKALFDAGIPITAFAVPDVQSEYERLVKLGVVFKTARTNAGAATIAVFDDTCGNWIQLFEA